MKKRTSKPPPRHGPEFKGVVKKMAGRLTNRPDLVEEGRAEMFGRKTSGPGKGRRAAAGQKRLHPDPHRRG